MRDSRFLHSTASMLTRLNVDGRLGVVELLLAFYEMLISLGKIHL